MSISYAPGSWILIAGREVNVLLPESEKQRAALVWATIDSGAGFAETLDAIVSAGLAGLSGFALVAEEGGATRVVVRGDLRVELRTADRTTVVSGTGTWAEESVAGVEGVSVWAESAGDQRLTLEEGLVRAAGFESGTASVAQAPVAPIVTEAAAPPVAPWLSLVPPAAPVALGGVREMTEEFDADELDADEPADEFAGYPTDDSAEFGEAAEEPLDAPEVEADDFDDASTDDFGVLGILPEQASTPEFSDIPPPPAFPPPAYAPEAAADEEPPAAEPAAEDIPSTPIFAQAPEPVGLAQPVRLAFSHGDNVEVTAPVVVGRAPHPDRFSHLADPLVVRVPSPHQEISGTHVAILPSEEGTVVVTDLGSTNGTLVIRGGGAPEELRPGVGVTINRGDVIDLGDSLTIKIV